MSSGAVKNEPLKPVSPPFFQPGAPLITRSAEAYAAQRSNPNKSNALLNTPNVNPYLITVKQAAARLQLGVNCVYGLTKAEHNPIPTVLIGRSIRIPTAALERWLEAQTRG